MEKQKTITPRELQRQTGAPEYLIAYLRKSNRLPVVVESPGKGYPTIYDISAIEIVRSHIRKS